MGRHEVEVAVAAIVVRKSGRCSCRSGMPRCNQLVGALHLVFSVGGWCFSRSRLLGLVANQVG